MCGIVGFTSFEKAQNAKDALNKMLEALAHRGPDDAGEFHSQNMHLGHRRLSIIGIENGSQPIKNETGALVLIANGEIYNYLELRERLKARGHVFATFSDSEVILHLFEEEGERCLNKLNGMFAFAIWNEENQSLFLARDRFGQKPLYYSLTEKEIVFASELKSMLKHPLINKEIDKLSLCRYFAYEYIPSQSSIFRGINKLLPGHYMKFDASGINVVEKYWEFQGKEIHRDISEDDACYELFLLFENSVKRRLISDVPLGVFLSGGVDSSAIAAVAARNSTKKIKTFSIAFEDPSFDESAYAAEVAEHIGTEHYEKRFGVRELFDSIECALPGMDEPFADASFLPTFLLSDFTKSHVTVALGGDGSDELFCGYPTFAAEQFARLYNLLPEFAHNRLIKPLADRIPVSSDNFSLDFKIKQFLKGAREKELIRHQVWLGAFSIAEMSRMLEEEIFKDFLHEEIYAPSLEHRQVKTHENDVMNILSNLYVKTYLADDILTKIDRASMAVSLETRSPFLDFEFADFVSALPGSLKIRGLKTKYIFKKALKGILPPKIISRSKKGFGIPIAKWFRNELKDFITDNSFLSGLESIGIKKQYVKTLVDEHLANHRDNRKQLWTLFVLDRWRKNFAA